MSNYTQTTQNRVFAKVETVCCQPQAIQVSNGDLQKTGRKGNICLQL